MPSADWAVPLSDVRFDDDDVEVVAGAYRSGWLSQGPAVSAFEAAFAASVGASNAIAVSSGTAALQLICAAIRLRPGDEVVLPSLTFAATAAAIVHAGARPVFADISSEHRPWLSAEAVAGALHDRTRAIVTVGYGGHPGEVQELRRLAEERGVLLVEDAAHALGASVGERQAGTFGVAGAFSFFANKNLALGEGGMVVTDDPELAQRARLLRSHGLTSDTWARHRGDAVDYDVLEPGFNFRLDEARAALGQRLLQRLAPDNGRRALVAERYASAFAGVDGVQPAIEPERGVQNAWHIYPLLLDRAVDRAALRGRLRASGIQTSVHYPPLHATRAFRPASGTSLPVTDDYARRTVTIPMFPHLTEAQQGLVVGAIRDALSAR
jgi:dTDP-4-amino-4,6-dideoxygalactose transaminase